MTEQLNCFYPTNFNAKLHHLKTLCYVNAYAQDTAPVQVPLCLTPLHLERYLLGADPDLVWSPS